ncbi:unnamed protein product [Prunus armeniaca]
MKGGCWVGRMVVGGCLSTTKGNQGGWGEGLVAGSGVGWGGAVVLGSWGLGRVVVGWVLGLELEGGDHGGMEMEREREREREREIYFYFIFNVRND